MSIPYLFGQSVITNTNSVHINIESGAVVNADTIDNLSGTIWNFGSIFLTASFNNQSILQGDGLYDLKGNWNNTGTFIPGSSKVRLSGDFNQEVINSVTNTFSVFEVNHGGLAPGYRVWLRDSLFVNDSLILRNGWVSILPNTNVLTLVNPDTAGLFWQSGRIVGKFNRAINSPSVYLYPIGSESSFNPLNFYPRSTPTAGFLRAEFIQADPGDQGLPLQDTAAVVDSVLRHGYWSLVPDNAFASDNYFVSLQTDGFSDVDTVTRIIRRDSLASGTDDWELDGVHRDWAPDSVSRDSLVKGVGVSFLGIQLGIARSKPRIIDQPENDTVCELDVAEFSVRARGRKLKYQWQIWNGFKFVSLADSANYSGHESNTLTIDPALLYMNGSQYRVVIRDRFGNKQISDTVLLFVEQRPTVTATPDQVLICDGDTTGIGLTSDIPVSEYQIQVIYSGVNITGAAGVLDGDTIRDILSNTGTFVDSVKYRILPFGAGFKACEGTADTATVYVNPTPEISVNYQPNDTLLCNGESIEFDIQTNLVTFGTVRYRLDIAFSSGSLTNVISTASYHDTGQLLDTLNNSNNTYESVTYIFEPFIENGASGGDCFRGIPVSITFYVNPTPEMTATTSYDLRCNEDTVAFATDSLSSSLGQIKYKIDAFYGDDLTGLIITQQTEPMGVLIDSLVNAGRGVDSVVYFFDPFIENGTNRGNCNSGDTVVQKLFINPTPSMFAEILDKAAGNDTIFCNGDPVTFELDSNVLSTTGMLLYDLGLSKNTAEISGESPVTGAVIDTFTHVLSHSEDSIQRLNYNFSPWIDNPGAVPDCFSPSDDTTVLVAVAPVLTSSAESDSAAFFIGGNDIRCFGDLGGFTVDPDGGDYRFAYSYAWEDSTGNPVGVPDLGSTGNLTNIGAGFYRYIVEDVIGCALQDTFRLTEPELLHVDSIEKDEPLCFGQESGSIDVSVTGGITGYDYEWRFIGAGGLLIGVEEDIYNIKAGAYRFSVTDTNQCQHTQVFILDSPIAINSSVTQKSQYGAFNTSCNGTNDGSLRVTVNGGAPPYIYLWRNEEGDTIGNSLLLNNIGDGTYEFKVVDFNGCTNSPEFIVDSIVEPDPITFTKMNAPYPGGWDISCFGAEDGNIDLAYFGGHTATQIDSYAWTGPGIDAGNENDSIQNNSSLPPGEYAVEVTDFQGCTGTYYDTLYQPEEIIPYYSTSEDPMVYFGRDVRCYGDSSGFVRTDSVTGAGRFGGEAVYEYEWTVVESYPAGFMLTNNTLEDQDNLVAGTYNLTITDTVTGCTAFSSFTLDTTPRLFANTLVDTFGLKNGYGVRCFGGADGTVWFPAQGGTAPYRYSWNDTQVTADSVTSLEAGIHTLEIADTNDCRAFYAFELESPPPIVIGYDSAFISCFGGTETININPSGGNERGPYEFNWTWDGGNSTSEDIVEAEAGEYDIRITDINDCFADSTIILYESPEILIDLSVESDWNGKDISCFGALDGAISATVSGGRGDYNYRWTELPANDLPDNANQISGIGAGMYRLIVYDFDDQCTMADSISVEQPDPITLDTIAANPLCSGDTTGSIEVIPFGGTAPYYFAWTHDLVLQDNIATGLAAGTYPVEIEDINDCIGRDTVILTDPDPIGMLVETEMAECSDVADGSVSITPFGGTPLYTISLEGPQGTFEEENVFLDELTLFSNMAPGNYIITITDDHECVTINSNVVVDSELPSCITISNAFTPNGDGQNDLWVIDDEGDGTSGDMYVYPDAELRIYNRWGELIYHTSNVADEPWDGTYKGRPMPIDSYYYILDLKTGEKEDVIRGNVTIIR